ncbi:MAG: polysaccharide deacetylase [Lachnospiraceae bacterium]|nr:polysaccharide deacetylase [Lachnospiraceae bacterium]
MSDILDPKAEADRKREKRKRVHRMKMGIITFIGVWMLVSILATVLLTIKVFSLQRQLNTLSQKIQDSLEAQETEQNGSSTVLESGDVLVTNYNGTAESNLAEVGDTLKVYLTFDDGPSANTSRILDVLDDYNVKATFFVVGKTDDESKALYKRIVDEGHTIAMHSYSHNYSDLYQSLDSFSADFERIQNTIYDATGVESHLYRFPGGSSNQVSNTNMSEYIRYLNEHNITYMDWNVSSGDATSAAYTADELVENVMSDVVKYKTSVVLLHDADGKTTTVDALPKMIESLQSQGALILPISEDTTLIQHVSLVSNDQGQAAN